MSDLTQTIQDVAGLQSQSTANTSQYGINPVPYHVHNNSDAPRVNYNDLAGNPTSSNNVIQITTTSSYTLNTDLYDALSITALASTLNTLSTYGNPNNFDRLIIRIKDNGSSQTLDWGTTFASYGVTLPTATIAGKIMSLGFVYDSIAALWGLVAYVHT